MVNKEEQERRHALLRKVAAGLALAAAAVAGFLVPWLAPFLLAAFAASGLLMLSFHAASRDTDRSIGHRSRQLDTQVEASLDRIIDSFPDPVIIFDRRGDLLTANRTATRTFGKLARGADIRLVFRSPDMVALVSEALENGSASSTEIVFRLPVELVFNVRMVPVDQPVSAIMAVFTDRSELRHLERMRSDFIANASHELRTPLASISGFIETLEGPAANDAAARTRFLAIMKSQADRMARLIDDLLSLSRLEMKTSAPRNDKVDLALHVRQVCSALSGLADENKVRIETDWAEGSWQVAGDADEIHQVLENLVANACKYGNGGGRVVMHIEPAVLGGGSAVAVTVEDFGRGIAKEDVPRLTERFYRANAGSAAAQKGTGLGLAIVKHIVTLHKGRLAIQSTPGKGSRFTVLLPSYNAVTITDEPADLNDELAVK